LFQLPGELAEFLFQPSLTQFELLKFRTFRFVHKWSVTPQGLRLARHKEILRHGNAMAPVLLRHASGAITTERTHHPKLGAG
jgi:hypothetical protein